MKNQRNENGRPHGPWEWYYSDGRLWYRGNYKNGKLHGLWESYHSNRDLRSKGTYKRGTRVGLWHHQSK